MTLKDPWFLKPLGLVLLDDVGKDFFQCLKEVKQNFGSPQLYQTVYIATSMSDYVISDYLCLHES